MSLLKVSHISKRQDGTDQLIDISFRQEAFQKIAIAGATGSGKTTLLKVIAGLEQPDSGEVLFEGRRVRGPFDKLIPGHHHIAYLSQHFELRNHYRVEELLEMANLLGNEALHIYEVCRISHLLKRWSHQLSGGERQRVSLARLLVTAPRLLVLDEPYSNLDAIHTNLLKEVVSDIGAELKVTCLLVSHDPHDLLPWADEIIVLQQGRIIQKGTPFQVYKVPVNDHVAALLGKYNKLSPQLAHAFSSFSGMDVGKYGSYVRPEDFTIVNGEERGVRGTLENIHFMGGYYELEINLPGGKIIAFNSHGTRKKGDTVYVSLS